MTIPVEKNTTPLPHYRYKNVLGIFTSGKFRRPDVNVFFIQAKNINLVLPLKCAIEAHQCKVNAGTQRENFGSRLDNYSWLLFLSSIKSKTYSIQKEGPHKIYLQTKRVSLCVFVSFDKKGVFFALFFHLLFFLRSSFFCFFLREFFSFVLQIWTIFL